MILTIFYVLFSAFSYSVSNMIQKKISNKLNSYEAVLSSLFFVSIFSFILMLIFEKNYNFLIYSSNNLKILIFGGIAGMVALLFLFKSFEKNLKYSQIFSITSTSPFFVFLLYIIFLGKEIHFLEIVIVILIFIWIQSIMAMDIENFYMIGCCRK